MQKLSALALLGTTMAANAPGPLLPTSNFPRYPDYSTGNAAPQAGDKNADGSVKTVYSNNRASNMAGVVRGYRAGITAFPTQNVAKATAATGSSCTIAAQTTSRTFYPTTATLVGTQPGVTDGAGGTQADGPVWLVCELSNTIVKCNGGAGWDRNVASGGTSNAILYRVGALIGSTAVITSGTATTTAAYTWDQDLLMATLYAFHAEPALTDGTKWCSGFQSTLAAAGTVINTKITMGFDSNSKCSFYYVAADNTVGPVMKIKTASALTFHLGWMEFADITAMGSQALLPATDGAEFHLGVYTVATDFNWINPLKTLGGGAVATNNWDTANNIFYTSQSRDNRQEIPGSFGMVNYFPGFAGDNKEGQTAMMPAKILNQFQQTKKSEVNQYNSDKSSYDTQRTDYNTANAGEKARLTDVFKAGFDPRIMIPTRPCCPTRPNGWGGIYLDLAKGIAATQNTQGADWTNAGKLAWPIYTISGAANTNKDNIANIEVTVRMGYVLPIADTAAGTKALGIAGHVFGLLGQGAATMPDGDKPFRWVNLTAATNKAGMMLTAFSEKSVDTLLDGAAKIIEIDVNGKAFGALGDYAPNIGQPGSCKNPDPAYDGAKTLGVSIAAGLVIASLI